MTQPAQSPFKRLTPQNECQIREIQEAATRQGVKPIKDDIIAEALRVTGAADYSSAVHAYRAQLTRDQLMGPSQCRVANNSPAR
jgi:hypothetical protein